MTRGVFFSPLLQHRRVKSASKQTDFWQTTAGFALFSTRAVPVFYSYNFSFIFFADCVCIQTTTWTCTGCKSLGRNWSAHQLSHRHPTVEYALSSSSSSSTILIRVKYQGLLRPHQCCCPVFLTLSVVTCQCSTPVTTTEVLLE